MRENGRNSPTVFQRGVVFYAIVVEKGNIYPSSAKRKGDKINKHKIPWNMVPSIIDIKK